MKRHEPTLRRPVVADNMSPERRSYTMSRIRSQGNESTEKRVARILRVHRIKGWRRHVDLPGKPDFVFPDQRVAIFVDGCFWHGCPRCGLRSKTNTMYWKRKIEDNRRRDRKTRNQLQRIGWSVLRIWEHGLRDPERIAERLIMHLRGTRRVSR
jgi:DNA mismatch endonuclease, patch repair protein